MQIVMTHSHQQVLDRSKEKTVLSTEDSGVDKNVNSSDSAFDTPPNFLSLNLDKTPTKAIDVDSYVSDTSIKHTKDDFEFSSKINISLRKEKVHEIDGLGISASSKRGIPDNNNITDNKSAIQASNASNNPPNKKVIKKISILSKEEKKIKAELEKKEREAKKRKLEEEKVLKKMKLDQERELKKRKIEQQKELKRNKIAAERELKKRKLEEEKEERRKRVEVERLERELKKRKIEEEKERRRMKIEEEKEEKRMKIEAEKLQKKKLEESREKSQSRISSFFSVSKKVGNLSTKKTDYSNTFLNFNLKEACYLLTNGSPNADRLNESIRLFDEALSKKSDSVIDSVEDWLKSDYINTRLPKSQGFKLCKTAEDIVNSINGDNLDEIEIIELLQNLPVKYLQFYENIRPPYCGTYTKRQPDQLETIESSSAATNGCGYQFLFKLPYTKLPNIDYSYDSDFEWNAEDDEDGGEIDDLDEDDDEDEDGAVGIADENNSDLESFVDDEEDSGLTSNNSNNRKRVIGKLVPVVNVFNIDNTIINGAVLDNDMMACMVVPELEFPINPFRNYWPSNNNSCSAINSPSKAANDDTTSSQTKNYGKQMSLMSSSKIENSSKVVTEVQHNHPHTSSDKGVRVQHVTNILTARKKNKTVITDKAELKRFVKYVSENNDFTTSTLVEILKKKFSTYTKIIVKNTLEHVACKKGPKANDKVWIINDEFQIYLN